MLLRSLQLSLAYCTLYRKVSPDGDIRMLKTYSSMTVLVLLSLASELVWAGTSPAIAYYDVSGETDDAIVAQLRARSPIDAKGIHRDGMSYHMFAYKYRTVVLRSGCKLERFDATLQSSMLLPRWTDAARNPNSAAKCRTYWNALYRHEMGHVERANAALEDLKALPQHYSAPMKCTDVDGILKHAFDDVIARLEKIQDDYDLVTAHGENQGAVFP